MPVGANERGVHLGRVEGGQMQQLHVTGQPFHERADRGTVVESTMRVAFPTPGPGAIVGFEAALMHRQHRLREPLPGAYLTGVPPAVITPRPQR